MKQTIEDPDGIETGDVIHYGGSRHRVVEVDVVGEMLVPGDDGLETSMTAGVKTTVGRHGREDTISYERLSGVRSLTVTRNHSGAVTA